MFKNNIRLQLVKNILNFLLLLHLCPFEFESLHGKPSRNRALTVFGHSVPLITDFSKVENYF